MCFTDVHQMGPTEKGIPRLHRNVVGRAERRSLVLGVLLTELDGGHGLLARKTTLESCEQVRNKMSQRPAA